MSIELGDFQVGDQYDLPPSYASKLISAVKALGGEVVLDGNTVIIISLPDEYLAANPLPTLVPFAVEPAPEPAPAPEAKLEEAAALISEYNAEVAAAPEPEPDLGGSEPGTAEIGDPVDVVEEAPTPVSEEASAPAPVKRGRKPAASKAV